jgi:hypothetical protein
MSFAKHKALDELHSALSEKVDLLVEAFIGRTARKQPIKTFVVETKATTDTKKIETYLEAERDRLVAMSKNTFADCPDIKNIVDEMIAEINKTLYLCRLS